MATYPDIFTNVHKGIRRALFSACTALGRAGDDEARGAAARGMLREALRFVEHHGDNEDVLLVPLLRGKAPAIAEHMAAAHVRVGAAVAAVVERVEEGTPQELYERTCELVAVYLEHMREEEQVLDSRIRAVLSVEELAGFGRGSVERTAEGDKRMMLGWMLPAMPRPEAEAYLGKLPRALAEELRSGADVG